MKLQLFLDSMYFSILYSQAPFYLLDFFEASGGFFFAYDNPTRKYNRYLLIFIVSNLFFYWFHTSGYHNRYIIYHLERKRRHSGLQPLEILLTCLYFSMYIFPFEILIASFDTGYPTLQSTAFPLHLFNKVSNIFCMSFAFHYTIEKMGFMDSYRQHYFIVDR